MNHNTKTPSAWLTLAGAVFVWVVLPWPIAWLAVRAL